MRPILMGLAALTLLLGGIGEASAGFIYDIQNYPTLQAGFTLSGTITTDIDTGTLSRTDITAWTITITSAGGSANTYDSTMAGFNDLGTVGVDVSPTEITLTSGVLTLNDSSNYSPLQYNRTGTFDYVSVPYGTRNWFDYPAGSSDLGGNPWIIARAETSAVPEPASLTLFGIGMAGIAVYGWRRRKMAAA